MSGHTNGTWGLWCDMPGVGVTGPAAAASYIAVSALKATKYKNYAEVVSSNKSLIAVCFGIDKYEAETNARLMASAPELLEALTALVLSIDAGGATLGAMQDARAIIAKAEGNE